MRQAGLFGLSDHIERLSRDGDPLEDLEATVDFEYFRGWLVEGLGYGDGSKGGRPPFDPVSMFKALILQAQHNLSDARMEFMIRDRFSWMRFLGFDLGAPTPDECPPSALMRQNGGIEEGAGESAGRASCEGDPPGHSQAVFG